ncbi:MAG: ASCH domain-containing protein [Chloroflexi bacterium]|nr:ASCH domain-containing protein [Chloroflexota bacterium]
MKALSLRQPWASLIADGRKTIETRTWRTHYRGPLAIHASARPHGDLPTGGIVAVAWLYDCRPMEAADEDAACIARYDGAYAWLLSDVQPIGLIPCKGMLGLWTPSDDILRMLPRIQPAQDCAVGAICSNPDRILSDQPAD